MKAFIGILTAGMVFGGFGLCAAEKTWPKEPLRGVNFILLSKTSPRGDQLASVATKANFKQLKNWNVNLIRVVLNVDADSPWYAKKKGAGDFSPPPIPKDDPAVPYRKHLAALEQALDLADRYGIYVIPMAGNIVGRRSDVLYQDSDGTGFEDHLVEWWKLIAHRYGKHPRLLGYDLLNEPHSDRELSVWQTELLPRLARGIRAIDRDTYLIVEPGPWGMPNGFNTLKPLDDPKVVYSFHFYAPHTYTHQGVKTYSKAKVTYPGKIRMFNTSPELYWNRDRLLEYVQPARQFQQKHHARIWVGEFSVIRWAPNAGRWLADAIDIFEQYGWDWCYHSYGGWNGWSLTFDADAPASNQPDGGKTTDRLKLLQTAWAKNRITSPTTTPSPEKPWPPNSETQTANTSTAACRNSGRPSSARRTGKKNEGFIARSPRVLPHRTYSIILENYRIRNPIDSFSNSQE